jgi:hypothetical protein
LNTFFKHFWSVFIDFIKDFQDINYKNIPLPLLSTLQTYIDDEIKSLMKVDSFGDKLRNKIQKENQIQPHFDVFLSTIQNNHSNSTKTGNILIHDGDLLRFPREYLTTFDKDKTDFLFSPKMKNNNTYNAYIQNLKELGTVHLLDNYREDVKGLTNKLIKNTQSLFSHYHEHPVYSNKNFQNKFIEDIPSMVDLLVAYDNLFNQVNIACVIVGNTSGMFSRILALVANSRGIPSICTQHGIIANEMGYMPALASKYAVFGHYEKEWYQKQGVSENSLEITGHPRFDQIFTNQHMSKNEFIQNLQISSEKKLIFIATNMVRDINTWSSLIKQLTKNPLINIIIKPHPSEIKRLGTDEYKKMSSMYDSVKLVPPTMDLYDIISNTDIVVQEYTTVGLEAMIFNKPVFCLRKEDYYDGNDRYYFDKLEKFTHYDPIVLAKMIGYFLENSNMQNEWAIIKDEFLSNAYPQKISGKKFQEFLFNLTGIKVYATADKIVDGMLVKGKSQPIYLIVGGKKCHILSKFEFEKLGFNSRDIRIFDDNTLNQIQDGPTINSENVRTFIQIKTDFK